MGGWDHVKDIIVEGCVGGLKSVWCGPVNEGGPLGMSRVGGGEVFVCLDGAIVVD